MKLWKIKKELNGNELDSSWILHYHHLRQMKMYIFISSSVLFSLESEIKYNIFLIQWEIKIQRENISKN